MILCVGEILADMIGRYEGGSQVYERKAGGAPFNVACGVKKFGAESVFVGSVGDDIIGRYLHTFAQKHVGKAYVPLDPAHNTTLAFVELDASGDRSFCFYRKETADLFLPAIPAEEFRRASIVHIGSLMLGDDRGVDYAVSLAQTAKNAKKLVSFDVNYREDVFPDKARAVKIYKTMLEISDIVKLSEEERETFGEKYIAETLKEQLVCITLGARGCAWRYRGESNTLPTIPLKAVDTTGAGDAFYAGALSRLDALPRTEWTRENLDRVFAFANVCGALTTQRRGAVDALPSLEEISTRLSFYA